MIEAIPTSELFNEFYKQIKEQYPQYTKEQVFQAVCYPYKHAFRTMEDGDLDAIRIKYLGIFQVRVKRAENLLMNMQERFRCGQISKKLFDKRKEVLERYIKKCRNEIKSDNN